MKVFEVVHPFEGVVMENKLKMVASDLLANEENVVRKPEDIDTKEAFSICMRYGYYTFTPNAVKTLGEQDH